MHCKQHDAENGVFKARRKMCSYDSCTVVPNYYFKGSKKLERTARNMLMMAW